MSNVNTPSGSGDRRLNVSRLLVLGGVLAVVLAAGYLLLREPPQTAPLPEGEAPKDMAAVFESLQGNVKTRGVGGLEWRTAETRNPLRKSDLVRTYPSSSAEIKFFDETRVTVRPDSLITIEETSRDPNASSKVAWKVSSGEINYETAQKGAGSAEAVTPTFRLALESNSAGTMRVGESGLAAVAQFAGGANLETKTGEKIRLGANEGIRVDADGRAGAKQVLPSVPVPAVPGSSGLVSLPTDAPVVLAWSASAGATSYRVVIESKEGQSVKEVVVDREGIKETSGSFTGIGAGDFAFRVAGLTGDGVQGKFSAPVAFKVARTAPVIAAAPAAPPLVISAFEARDNVLRLVGKTEPGARLTVNGDPVTVQPDGSFSEFVTLARKQGERRVVIRVTSRSGGIAEETRALSPSQ